MTSRNTCIILSSQSVRYFRRTVSLAVFVNHGLSLETQSLAEAEHRGEMLRAKFPDRRVQIIATSGPVTQRERDDQK